MIFEEKKITLKDGRIAILKSPDACDSEKMLNYIKQSFGETDFLSRYPEEFNITAEQEEVWITRRRSSPDSLMITCYVDGEISGSCEIVFTNGIKTSHRATISIAILKSYWNLGIGSAMLKELVAAARNRGTELIELEFVEGNDRAKHLYEKFGFHVVAEKPNTLKLKNGTYLSEFYMQKVMRKPINKLVRDNIPLICKENGQKTETKVLNDEEYTLALHEKLKEEVAEYFTSGEIEELADIVEVAEALADNQGSSLEEVMKIKQNKQNKNGAFRDRVFLISVDD